MKKQDTYVCIDLETTGLNPKADRIIEIGAVKVVDGVETDHFETFINPGRSLEGHVKELTGITDGDLEKAPKIKEVLPELLEFIGDHVLLGHSILFDFSFIKKAAVNEKLLFEKEGIDTLKIARKYLPELESRSLGFLCEYYRIPHKAHRALEDARATVRLYEELTNRFLSPDSEKDFQPGKLKFNVKRDTPASKAQIERLYKLIDKHKIDSDNMPDGMPKVLPVEMTRSEASRYADLILAKFGR